MRTPTIHRAQLTSVLSLLVVLAPSLRAQTAAPAASQSKPASQVVTLDPFEVSETSDKSYGALNSNSITAFNTSLDKMPVSADVYDSAFMNDTAFNTVEEMLNFYAAGSGTSSTQPDLAAQNSQTGDRPNNGTFSVGGLSVPTALVNGFFPVGTGGVTGAGQTSNFDLEKVEIINGPQALLYGVSGAGGAINYTTKQARLGAPALAEDKFQVDQYGHKLEQLDYGAGTDVVALRVALIDQTIGARRVFLGGPMEGAYAQLAVRPFKSTTIRISLEKQTYDRIFQTNQSTTFTAASTSNDARNGDNLRYLLATNQLQAAANGAPSGAGPIPGINWNNVDSLGGALYQEYRDYDRSIITADTVWTSWLTSMVAAGYSRMTDFQYSNTSFPGYDAPNVSANPTGTFAVVANSSVGSDLSKPSRTKAARASLLADNQLFGGSVDSKTVLGADTSRSDGATIQDFYVSADSNWSSILTAGTSYNGTTVAPSFYYPVPNGPIEYPGFNPQNTRITVNGQNYVRATTNDTDSALISPANPEGLTGHGKGDFRHSSDINSGYYFANYTDFLGGNLDTLFGARFGNAYYRNETEGSTSTNPSVLTEAHANFIDLDAGVNVKLFGPVRAYAEVSENENPPTAVAVGPLGAPLLVSKGLGEEIGLKASTPVWNISSQLALYHTNSQNEETAFTGTLINDINPTGINGQFGAPSDIINVDRQSEGIRSTLTAAPPNWRIRLAAAISDSRIESNVSFKQVYNDQFNENAAGDVTYADGTIVYVNPTFNSKGTIAAPASSAPAGYIPLTVANMNSSTNTYYANPEPITAQINPTSNVHTVLEQTDPTHGSIATGQLGLPMSYLQIAPNASAPPPGTIAITQVGQLNTGVPKFSVNFIAVYTLPSGPLKGLFAGPSGSIGWKQPLYYYYPQTVSAVGVPEVAYFYPTETVFHGLLGYTRKLKHVTFTTQVNCYNLFNHYHVLVLPNTVTGFTSPLELTATFDQQPREYLWTTTIRF